MTMITRIVRYIKNGTNALNMVMTPETSAVRCDVNGNVIGTFTTVTLKMYNGTTDVTSSTVFAIFSSFIGLKATLSGNTLTFSELTSGITGDTTAPAQAQITVTGTYNGTTLTKTHTITTVRDGDAGENNINIVISPETVAMKKQSSAKAYAVDITVYDGETQVEYDTTEGTGENSGFICSRPYNSSGGTTLFDGNVTWRFSVNGAYTIRHAFTLLADNEANGSVYFVITYKGVEYTRWMTFTTTADGTDALTVSVTPSQIAHEANGAAGDTTQSTVSLSLLKGGTEVETADWTGYGISSGADLLANYSATDKTTYINYTIELDDATKINSTVTFYITYQGTTYYGTLAIVTAEQGIQGMVQRVSVWAEDTEYHNDESETTSPRYLDIALLESDSTTGYTAYQCLKTHYPSSADNKPGTTGGAEYWKVFNMHFTAIYTSLIVAKNAVIKFGTTNRLVVMDTSGQNIQGCFTGVNDEADYMLWIGGTLASSANFKVSYAGYLEATGVSISGEIKAEKGSLGGFTLVAGRLGIDESISDGDSGMSLYEEMISFRLVEAVSGTDTVTRQSLLGVMTRNSNPVLCSLYDVQVNENAYSKYGIVVDIENSYYMQDFAMWGKGVLSLKGFAEGWQYVKMSPSSASTIIPARGSSAKKDTETLDSFKILLNASVSAASVALPTLSQMRRSLGITDTTQGFAVTMTYVGCPGCAIARVYGRGTSTEDSDEYPTIIDNQGHYDDYVTVSQGDAYQIMLIYDPLNTNTITYSVAYCALIISEKLD